MGLKAMRESQIKRSQKKKKHLFTFCRISWLIFVNGCLNITERGRRTTLLQHSNGITKLICKLQAKRNVAKLERIYQLSGFYWH